VAGPGDASFVSFKSSLHDFCQKYKLPPPQYISNQGSQGYSAKLKFGGLFFQSSSHFTARIEAEQHAAFEALQGLGLLESSVEFDANNISGGMNSSGVVIGGGGSGSVSASNTMTRQTSRGGSRANSRPPSRPGSRQGSMNHLNVSSSNQYNVNTSFDQRDASYNNSIHGSRTFSTGSGYDGQHSNRHEQHISADNQMNTSYHSEHGRNDSVSGHSVSSLHRQQYGQAFAGTNNMINSTSSSSALTHHQRQQQQDAVTGYDDGDVYAFSYSNYTGSGTVPRSRSQSYQDYDNTADFEDGNGYGDTHHLMQHDQYSRTSSGYATMPRKQLSNGGGGSSSYVQVCTISSFLFYVVFLCEYLVSISIDWIKMN